MNRNSKPKAWEGPVNICGPNAHKFFNKNLDVVCACEGEREGERSSREKEGIV